MKPQTAKPKGKPTSTKPNPNPNPIRHTFESIYPLAVEASLKPDNAFIQDITASLPCSYQTFYTLMNGHNEEFDVLKANLYNNKIAIKQKLRKRWQDSDNATLQISLYKLLSTDEEFAKLANIREDKHEETPLSVRLVPNRLAGEDD